jgi:hypothetical protein
VRLWIIPKKHARWCGREETPFAYLATKLPVDLMKFHCEVLAPRERLEMFSYWQMTSDYLKPVIELLLVIWGFFAGLQWLIRGALT